MMKELCISYGTTFRREGILFHLSTNNSIRNIKCWLAERMMESLLSGSFIGIDASVKSCIFLQGKISRPRLWPRLTSRRICRKLSFHIDGHSFFSLTRSSLLASIVWLFSLLLSLRLRCVWLLTQFMHLPCSSWLDWRQWNEWLVVTLPLGWLVTMTPVDLWCTEKKGSWDKAGIGDTRGFP